MIVAWPVLSVRARCPAKRIVVSRRAARAGVANNGSRESENGCGGRRGSFAVARRAGCAAAAAPPRSRRRTSAGRPRASCETGATGARSPARRRSGRARWHPSPGRTCPGRSRLRSAVSSNVAADEPSARVFGHSGRVVALQPAVQPRDREVQAGPAVLWRTRSSAVWRSASGSTATPDASSPGAPAGTPGPGRRRTDPAFDTRARTRGRAGVTHGNAAAACSDCWIIVGIVGVMACGGVPKVVPGDRGPKAPRGDPRCPRRSPRRPRRNGPRSRAASHRRANATGSPGEISQSAASIPVNVKRARNEL